MSVFRPIFGEKNFCAKTIQGTKQEHFVKKVRKIQLTDKNFRSVRKLKIYQTGLVKLKKLEKFKMKSYKEVDS